MATASPAVKPPATLPSTIDGLSATQRALSRELRRMTRFATFVVVVASPSVFLWLHHHRHMGVGKSLLLTFLACIAFRGAIDIVVRKLIPWPSLFGSTDAALREEDIVNRRRWWTWSAVYKWAKRILALITVIFAINYFIHWWQGDIPNPVTWSGEASRIFHGLKSVFSTKNIPTLIQVFFLFIANMLLFMGPLLAMGVMQIKAFEPGDAEWGVKLDDVRGQPEAKEEIRRVVTLWQSGELFEKAGGKRERGLLFLGAPGTGKTMMAKAIATSFNSPFITIPGSGFAQAFVGIDAVVVRVLAWRAKRLATKWGGNCIVFIDEIDAVGMRRAALGGGNRFDPAFGGAMMNPLDDATPTFYGPRGALTSSGDVIVESAAWREHLFRLRADEPRSRYPGWHERLSGIVNQGIFPGMGMGGGLALNQLLIVMDGVDNPPFFKRLRTNRFNTILDAIYILPRRYGKRYGQAFCALVGIGAALLAANELIRLFHGSPVIPSLVPVSRNWTIILVVLLGWFVSFGIRGFRSVRATGTVTLRVRQAKPSGNQVYFIGATNVPVEALDPALTRAGRMGRHVTFRTPTKEDRKDIFELYLGKVAHDPSLDTPERRDEIARITNGYAPAEIEQICSMALTAAHHDGRAEFSWEDLVEAMTVSESGTAVDVNFIEEDQRATAIHEAGHAAAAHVYRPEVESSRLSIRMRGRSGGHHQSFEKEERFGKFQSMMFGELIHLVGAMAAELAFYGENSNGVGGDMQMSTFLASRMAGAGAMSPLPIELNGKTFPGEDQQQSYDRVMRRFEDIGYRMMNRTAAGFDAAGDPRKRVYVAQFMGMALVVAYNLMITNKEKVDTVARVVNEKKEIFGDDLVKLLDAQHFEAPVIDWTADETWPKIMNWSRDPREMRLVGEHGDGPPHADGPPPGASVNR